MPEEERQKREADKRKARKNNGAKRGIHYEMEQEEHDVYPEDPDFDINNARLVTIATRICVRYECVPMMLDGILVPFFLEEYRFRSDTTALVKLEGVDTAERARMFTNIEVYFPVKHAEEAGPGELSWDFFVGFRMEEVHHGTLGEVTDVDTSTINTLFVVDYQGEELLVPAQEEFIIDIDQKHKVITVDLPEGLIALDKTEEV